MVDWDKFWEKSLIKANNNLAKTLNILNRKKKLQKLKRKINVSNNN
jgi:hypothetical protein